MIICCTISGVNIFRFVIGTTGEAACSAAELEAPMKA